VVERRVVFSEAGDLSFPVRCPPGLSAVAAAEADLLASLGTDFRLPASGLQSLPGSTAKKNVSRPPVSMMWSDQAMTPPKPQAV